MNEASVSERPLEELHNFCKRLKDARLKLGLSQTEAAKALGVGKNTFWRYEKGETLPSESDVLFFEKKVKEKFPDAAEQISETVRAMMNNSLGQQNALPNFRKLIEILGAASENDKELLGTIDAKIGEVLLPALLKNHSESIARLLLGITQRGSGS